MALQPSRPLCWVAGLIALAAGCATPARHDYTPVELRLELLRRVPELEWSDAVIPFELDSERISQARVLMRPGIESGDRAQQLVKALSDPDGFGLQYEWATTSTAMETLERGSGNCFSLSSVLVGLARGTGLRAAYVEVVLDNPRWRYDDGVAVHADHVAAMVMTRNGPLIVDFNGQLGDAGRVRAIGDLEALAHYYNNRGYERIHTSKQSADSVPWPKVRRDFDIATRIQPRLARAWNNLGVANSRLGDPVAAEAAYLRAVEIADLHSAHLNLGMLYLKEGNPEEAVAHLRAAKRLDPRNPQLDELMEDAAKAAAVLEGAADG